MRTPHFKPSPGTSTFGSSSDNRQQDAHGPRRPISCSTAEPARIYPAATFNPTTNSTSRRSTVSGASAKGQWPLCGQDVDLGRGEGTRAGARRSSPAGRRRLRPRSPAPAGRAAPARRRSSRVRRRPGRRSPGRASAPPASCACRSGRTSVRGTGGAGPRGSLRLTSRRKPRRVVVAWKSSPSTGVRQIRASRCHL